MTITLSMGYFITEVKNRATSLLNACVAVLTIAMHVLLLNACVAVLTIATSFSLIQNCGVIYKTNTAFIRVLAIFSSNSTSLHANSKIPSIHQS